MPRISFLRIVSMPFDENTYIVYREGDTRCVVVDPGLEPDKILEALEDQNLVPEAILNTHGHSDHIAGNGSLKERWPDCPLVIGWQDAEKLTNPETNLSAPFGVSLVSPPEDVQVREGETYEAAGIEFEVRETPGHSAGHVIFIIREGSDTYVLGGDVLFQRSVGRSDFPDGNFTHLKKSIDEKLFTLPRESIVLPGHGPPTTIGEEIEHNPFVGKPAGYLA